MKQKFDSNVSDPEVEDDVRIKSPVVDRCRTDCASRNSLCDDENR